MFGIVGGETDGQLTRGGRLGLTMKAFEEVGSGGVVSTATMLRRPKD